MGCRTLKVVVHGLAAASWALSSHLVQVALRYDVPGLDLVQVKVSLAPGARGPWHYHPGPAIIVVKRGTFKLTQDKKDCPTEEYSAGSVVVEEGFHIHQPSNPGSEETEIYTLFVIAPEPALDQIITEPKACKM